MIEAAGDSADKNVELKPVDDEVAVEFEEHLTPTDPKVEPEESKFSQSELHAASEADDEGDSNESGHRKDKKKVKDPEIKLPKHKLDGSPDIVKAKQPKIDEKQDDLNVAERVDPEGLMTASEGEADQPPKVFSTQEKASDPSPSLFTRIINAITGWFRSLRFGKNRQ